MIHQYDVVVIGGGIAGLYTALTAAVDNCKVAVVSKVHVTRSHSVAAQGGIAASLGNEEEDHWEWHMYDTVKGSDYLADQDAVEVLTKEAPNAIYTLEHMGVPFSRNNQGKIQQRRFGGHTRNNGQAPIKRACHVSDRTGRAIMDTLYDQCLQKDVKMHNEIYIPKPALLQQYLLWSRRIQHSQRQTSHLPCQIRSVSNRRMRKNFQNHQQRLRIHWRWVRISPRRLATTRRHGVCSVSPNRHLRHGHSNQ